MDMSSKCTVCSKSLSKNDDIFTTKCDHLFHYQCLKFWLEKMKRCPQCDKSATIDEIEKIDLIESHNIAENKAPCSNSRSYPQVDGFQKKQSEINDVLNSQISNLESNYEDQYYRAPRSATVLRGDDRNMRVEHRPMNDSRSARPVANIYNQGGTVIVCETYQPRTINYFGFSPFNKSTSIETPAPVAVEATQGTWQKISSWTSSLFSSSSKLAIEDKVKKEVNDDNSNLKAIDSKNKNTYDDSVE